MTESQRIPAFCTQCRSRCGCIAIIDDGLLQGIEPLPGHPSGEKLCPKGRAAPELVYHSDRITQPMRRTSPKGGGEATWEAISWDDALDQIAHHMSRIRDRYGAEQVAFSVTTPSGTHISDSIAWIERFIRAYGSPNTIYGTEICNWHKDVASRFTYGTDIGTPDFANTDCVLLWGNNPAATWLARATEIQKAIRKGAKLIVVDPRPTQFARRADCWLRVRPGTDQALALGLAHLLVESGRFDWEFVREWTNAAFLVRSDTGRFLRQSDLEPDGDSSVIVAASATGGALLYYDSASGRWRDPPIDADEFAACDVATTHGDIACRSALRIFADAAAQYPPNRVAALTGIDENHLRQAAECLAASASVAYYAWNGVGQSTTATQTDRAISILYGLTGSYGAKGGNVPGGAASFNDIAGHDLLSDQQRHKTLGLQERPLGPGRQGWVTARDVYRAITGNEPYPVRMLFSFGTNLVASQPDTALAHRALKELDFHVHADFFLNASAAYADIVLPVATSWEREGLRPGFDASLEGLRKVQLRPAVIAPVGESRSDIDIVLGLARRLGLAEQMFDCDPDKGHDHMLAPAGLGIERLLAVPEGLTLLGEVPLRAYVENGFPTPTRRLEIYSEQFLEHGYAPVPSLEVDDLPLAQTPRYPLRLGSAKTIAFCHSQHRNIASLRRLAPDPILEMAPEVAAARGIRGSDWVQITTSTGAFVARAKVTEGIASDAVFAQHGWTVDCTLGVSGSVAANITANMNAAVSTEHADPVSGSVPLRCSWCEVGKV